MDRRERILAGLDVAQLTGIEIGALDKPLVSPGSGSVLYVDHADTPTLRRKYAADPGVNLDALVDVDAVWGESTLRQALLARSAAHPSTPAQVDYVVASHVMEHVPDLIGWLGEIHEVLKPTGQLRLAVPDRRFTFDCLREDARLSDVLAAHLAGARRPMAQAILDSQLNAAPAANPAELWDENRGAGAPVPQFDWEYTIQAARGAIAGIYHDAHCWAVTPYSLADIFVALAEHGLLHLACAKFEDTSYGNIEFYLRMVPCDEPSIVAESWRRVRQEARQTAPGSRFRPIDVLSGAAAPSATSVTAAGTAIVTPDDSAELAQQRRLAHERFLLVQAMEQRARAAESLAEERFHLARSMEARALAGEALASERLDLVRAMEVRAASVEAALGQVRRSTSWRLTRPVRAAARALRGAQPATPGD